MLEQKVKKMANSVLNSFAKIFFTFVPTAFLKFVLPALAIISLQIVIAADSKASASRNLNIFTEPNMAVAISEIARNFSQRNNVIISVNFNSSQELVNNIDFGEPADVLITAHNELMANLRQKGLIDVYNIGYIARDSLVLVTSKSNPKNLIKNSDYRLSLENCVKILIINKAVLLVDNPGTASGLFAQNILNRFDTSGLNLVTKLAEDKSPLLNAFKDNNEIYSLVFASQIQKNSDLQVLARQDGLGVFYQAFVIAGNNMDLAREFLKYLRSDEAKKILQSKGFNTK